MGIDDTPTTKYLNFGGAGSGFIVTPTLLPGIAIDGFRITTGNDAPGRDPATWSLFGFDGTLTTTDSGASPAISQTGLDEAWVPIASGSVALPGDPAAPPAEAARCRWANGSGRLHDPIPTLQVHRRFGESAGQHHAVC
jgi:hypothetical protein